MHINKKFSLIAFCISLLLSNSLLSQQPSPNQKLEAFKKMYPALRPVKGPDLYPAIWMNCIDCNKEIGDALYNNAILPVKEIFVWVRNAGDQKSGSAQGRIEFYDRVTGNTTVRTFNIPPVETGQETGFLIHITGFFLIKGIQGREGVKVSVSFTDLKGMQKTNSFIGWTCCCSWW